MPSGRNPVGGQAAGGDGHRRGEVEHVDGAAPPDLAVDQLAAERVAPPPVGGDRHDVGVAHEQQGRRVGPPPLDPGHQAGSARGRLEALDVQARAVEVACQQVRAADLATRRARAVVDARVADEVLQQVGDLGGRGRSPPGTVAGGVPRSALSVWLNAAGHEDHPRRRRRFEHRHRGPRRAQPRPARRGGAGVHRGVLARARHRRRRRHVPQPHRPQGTQDLRGRGQRQRADHAAGRAPSAGATPSSCRSPAGPARPSSPTTRSRSSTASTPGCSRRVGSSAASPCPTWAGCSWTGRRCADRPAAGP